ncbi:MAG TPA: hypothetical protein VFP84_24270 [Kofleriaceae bacterium]|nr:hypothetical protein [Kofleriaceae bacterium]
MCVSLCLLGGIGCVTELGTGSDGQGGTADGNGTSDGDSFTGDNTVATNTLPVYPTAHPRIYLTPNKSRLVAALNAKTSAATRFKANVDAWVGGADIWGFEVWTAALMGQLTGSSTYCTKAVANVDAQVKAAEAKIALNQAPLVAADSYLEIGGMIGDLALTYDWCFAQVSTSQRSRWLKYADQAVSNVWHPSTAKWGTATIPWSGWATNDPSDNYYYSFLRATMLLGLASKGEDPQADAWITQFHDTKITNQLIPTFNADLVGGGSREGTGYGVAMRGLFSLYDLWQATTGESLATKTGHTRASMLSMLHQIVPTLDRFAPTGDQSRDSTASFFDYQRNYLQELIQQFPSDLLAQRAKTQLQASSLPQMSQSFMLAYDFLYDNANVSAKPLTGMNTSYYARGIGELYARSGWDTHATWVNFIAGPYTQSHAHQDQGSLMIYKDGWLAYDAVINSKSGLPQSTTSHSLVRVTSNGQPVPQIAATTSVMNALHQGTGYTYASADLKPAYNGNAAVQTMQREMVYLQPDVIVVFDRVRTASGTSQTWQLASPTAASISGSTASVTNAGHTLKVQKISGGTMAVTPMTAVDADFTGGYRLDETMAGGDNRYLHVISIDGSVSSTVSAGDATHPGVTVHLANGHNATITFVRDTPGATLVLDGTTKSLSAGVDSLSE